MKTVIQMMTSTQALQILPSLEVQSNLYLSFRIIALIQMRIPSQVLCLDVRPIQLLHMHMNLVIPNHWTMVDYPMEMVWFQPLFAPDEPDKLLITMEYDMDFVEKLQILKELLVLANMCKW